MDIFKNNKIAIAIALARQAFGKYKFQILVLAIFGFIGGLLEGIGVNALIPLFSFAVGDRTISNDFVSRQIEKFFNILDISFSIEYLLIFIALLFIFKSLVTVYLNYLRIKITADYEESTRSELFKKVLAADWPHLIKQKLGHLETILAIDVPAGTSLLNQIGAALTTATELLVYILIAINISLPITIITFVLGAALFFVFRPLFVRIKSIAYERAAINKKTVHHVSENILGIKTIKTMLASPGVMRRATEYFQQLKDLMIRSTFLKSLATSFIEPIAAIYVLIIFAFYYKSAHFNLAAFIVVVYLVQRIFLYVQQLERSVHTVHDSIPHVRSILNYETQAAEHKEVYGGFAAFEYDKNLEFRNVEFSYDGKKKILEGVNFIIQRGEIVGLIGPSGVGKTTVVDLILRLFEPMGGKILLDGKDISEIDLREWRKNIGYVSQDIFLMNDTIANNIRFYNTAITDQEMEEAAKMANIYDFIQKCENKFQTVIGERGIFLSVGQRQRIVIARILARKPQLLILDEATSALDNESEIKIQEVIENLKGKMTVLVIAHRLSTIVKSDKLIALENGQIVEQGEPAKLLADKDSYFFKIYNLRTA